jgi:hypothetical protein
LNTADLIGTMSSPTARPRHDRYCDLFRPPARRDRLHCLARPQDNTCSTAALWPHCRASATLIGAVTWR